MARAQGVGPVPDVLALKVPVALLVALPVLVLLRLNGVVLSPALLVLVFAGRRLADVARRLQGRWAGVGIARPYLPRPELQPTPQRWYWTGYDYHRSRLWAAVSSWFNWVLRDPAMWRDLVWMALDAVLGTVLLAPAVVGWSRPLRWHARWTRALLSPTDQAKLTARVRELAETRTEALDAQAVELERIIGTCTTARRPGSSPSASAWPSGSCGTIPTRSRNCSPRRARRRPTSCTPSATWCTASARWAALTRPAGRSRAGPR
nr:sensor domain-containing protein [Nonomuraea fuscirosea]